MLFHECRREKSHNLAQEGGKGVVETMPIVAGVPQITNPHLREREREREKKEPNFYKIRNIPKKKKDMIVPVLCANQEFLTLHFCFLMIL